MMFEKSEGWKQPVTCFVVRAHLASMSGEDEAQFCARWDVFLAATMKAFPC